MFVVRSSLSKIQWITTIVCICAFVNTEALLRIPFHCPLYSLHDTTRPLAAPIDSIWFICILLCCNLFPLFLLFSFLFSLLGSTRWLWVTDWTEIGRRRHGCGKYISFHYIWYEDTEWVLFDFVSCLLLSPLLHFVFFCFNFSLPISSPLITLLSPLLLPPLLSYSPHHLIA